MIAHFIKGIRQVVFPPSCVCCGQFSEELVCADCEGSLPLFSGSLCEKCGKPVHSHVLECLECRGKRFHISILRSLGRYDGNLKQLIRALKYSSAFKIADYLGEQMAQLIMNYRSQGDAIVTFVPIKRTKQALRGYNQAELLSRSVAGHLDLPVKRLLVKQKHTRDQSVLDKNERKKNIRDAFRCVDPGKVSGKTIILIDDVYTSGSTMNEAAKALICSGAREVIGLSAARTLTHL